MSARIFRSVVALALGTLLVLGPVAPAYGQEQAQNQSSSQSQGTTSQPISLTTGRDFSKGPSQQRNFFSPYFPMGVAEPALTNSPRVGQLIQDGKMSLTLEDAISLALENNMDITVQRYNPWIASTDILRTMGGGAGRGLAGTGTASALGSIPSQNFDPSFTITGNLDHRNIPVNNPLSTGAGVGLLALTNHTTQMNMSYSQGFHTGTGFAVTQNNTRSATNSQFAVFNPSVQSTLFVSVTQQLLNGFGLLPNTRFIRIAKNSKKIADWAFTQQVITTVTAVQNLYYELVFAREDVQVKQRSVELAQKLYNDNKRQVEIGTLAPIEVVRAEAEVARARQELIVSQTLALQQQTLLKNAITKNPLEPTLLDVEIRPTTVVTQVPQIDTVPMPDAVKEAYAKRPDVKQIQLDLQNRNIDVRATRNALLPTLSLFGQYGWTGLFGDRVRSGQPTGALTANLNNPIVNAAGVLQGIFTSSPVLGPSTFVQGGLGDSLNQIFTGRFPTYSVQLSLNVPIRNRPAQADNARAQLEERQTQARLRQLENNIVVEVRNAQIALEQNQARVQAARSSRVLQEQTLDAEQKKYQLGASTIFFVIQAQRDLAAAQSVELRALVDLVKSKVEYERALGRTLEANRISVADAKSGEVPKELNIPGTVSGEIVGTRGSY